MIENDRHEQLSEFVAKNKVQLHELKDQRGFTAVHFVTFKDNFNMAKTIFALVLYRIFFSLFYRRGTNPWRA